ncbi:heavy-metal-associated domain-containing protein [Ascidiimonas aurantiaca]|uniref:heavy-metal-associated domain-containing protein n=1 Tax=Ascidiimonas aurantiaca TaxID=1685432 RepID=UPI0030EC5251
MSTLTFKTNMKCEGCVSKVAPLLDNESFIDTWHVDLTGDERLLTVETSVLSPQTIKEIVEKCGFIAELTED